MTGSTRVNVGVKKGVEAKMDQTRNDRAVLVAANVMPDEDGGWQPVPPLRTPAEAVRYLRLHEEGPTNPLATLRYYRGREKLQGTRVGRRVFYTQKALDEFLDKVTG